MCMQSRYLQNSKLSNISFILSLISILVISLKSIDENPGVSAIREPSTSYNVVHLVVCFPLPKALDISFVSKDRFLSSLFNSDDFPAPDWPAITTFLFFIIFGSFIVYLSYNFFSNVSMILKINEEKKSLNDKLISLKDEQEILNADIKKLEDPDYVARCAREKYMYSKDGELIIRIPDDD